MCPEVVLEEPLSGRQVSACAGEERPSLFSDAGNLLPLFNHFATALSSLGMKLSLWGLLNF